MWSCCLGLTTICHTLVWSLLVDRFCGGWTWFWISSIYRRSLWIVVVESKVFRDASITFPCLMSLNITALWNLKELRSVTPSPSISFCQTCLSYSTWNFSILRLCSLLQKRWYNLDDLAENGWERRVAVKKSVSLLIKWQIWLWGNDICFVQILVCHQPHYISTWETGPEGGLISHYGNMSELNRWCN